MAHAISAGRTATYGELAQQLGAAGGARAVGQAMALNRFPIIVPCHRVVRSDGSLGGFGGSGPDQKRALIELEARVAAAIPGSKQPSFA